MNDQLDQQITQSLSDWADRDPLGSARLTDVRRRVRLRRQRHVVAAATPVVLAAAWFGTRSTSGTTTLQPATAGTSVADTLDTAGPQSATASPTTIGGDPTAVTLPSEVLGPIGVSGPRHILTADGVSVFVATASNGDTCVILDDGDGYPSSCFDPGTINTGQSWFLSKTYEQSPNLLAGIAPDDVTRVVVNGADATLVEHFWLSVSVVPIDSYTLVHGDGSTQTIDLAIDNTSVATSTTFLSGGS